MIWLIDYVSILLFVWIVFVSYVSSLLYFVNVFVCCALSVIGHLTVDAARSRTTVELN